MSGLGKTASVLARGESLTAHARSAEYRIVDGQAGELNMSKFWSPFVKNLVPYVPGEQPKLAKLVKLNTNENPYGPSPKALAAMQAELNDNLRLYPDPNSDLLKNAVAKYYGVQSNQVFLGNGSDEVLAHIFHGLLQHEKPLLFPDI